MKERYKIIISNKRLYREVELPEDSAKVKIGTVKGCEIRLNKEMFFEDIAINLEKASGKWFISCNDNLYISVDEVMKLTSKEIIHGDEVVIKYHKSNQAVFKLSFMLDFDFEKKSYNRVIQIGNEQEIHIGGSISSDITLNDDLIGKDQIILSCQEGKYYIRDINTRYGVYVNGVRIKEEHKLENHDFFSVIGYSFYLKNRELYTSQDSKIIFNGLSFYDIAEQQSCMEYPKYNRSTRVKYVVPDEEIEVLDPSAKPQKSKTNIVLNLLPAVAMLIMVVVLRGAMGGGGSFVIFSACSMGMGIVTSIFGFADTNKQYKKDLKKREVEYRQYIENKEIEIKKKREEERMLLEKIHYSLKKEEQFVEMFTGELFDRCVEDSDYLCVRIGTGKQEAYRKITYKKQERISVDDELCIVPQQISESYKYVEEAPIICDLKHLNAIGIIGTEEENYSIFKNIIMDICIRHYYQDVQVAVIIEAEKAEKISWVRLLPHIQNPKMNMRNIVCDDESKIRLYEYYYRELSQREITRKSEPQVIVFVYNDMDFKKHPISKYIDCAKDYGFTFVFFDVHKELLPQGCQYLLMMQGHCKGQMINSESANDIHSFCFELMTDEVARKLVSKIAAIYCEDVNLEGTLTKQISLFELLNIISVEDLDVVQRWNTSEIYKTMAAPLGVKVKNEVVCLDLHEKAHGPHGLVAGTTGSGKSEILQSYILSMATIFHPYEVGFVIIDFKGGGMVNQFRELPHLVGAITNIDGKEIERSLLSIKAELLKRQELFSLVNVNHINSYIKKFKKKECDIPLPHLILIVDEFAELKSEQPEFMKELISAARIGRSLGVHLILATQKPSGVVDDQIWSNSKFKLCLKVQNKQDSKEVLKSPLAAEIKEPGRAYLQVGNDEIFELFQSAYSGATIRSTGDNAGSKFQIYDVALSGRRIQTVDKKPIINKSEQITQLGALVEYVNKVCNDNQIVRLPGICLPPLPSMLRYEENKSGEKDGIRVKVPIGIYDDPAHQSQKEVVLDITTNHTLIMGSAQYGKTNLLQLIIRSIADSYNPKEVNIYILDCASMVLKSFESLNHVGGIITPNDDEKMKNFIKLMLAEMERRKELLSNIGLSSFVSYLESGEKDMCQIIIVIDNFIACRELFEQHDDVILNLCREGLSVGISVIMTCTQTSGMGYRYLSNFANRIVLYCNDSSQYADVFDQVRLKPANTPGRGIIELNKVVLEYQTYLCFEGEKEIERVQQMKEFIERKQLVYGDVHARTIPAIPALLTQEYLESNYETEHPSYYDINFGLYYESVDLFDISIEKIGMLGMLGRIPDGRYNFIRIIMDHFQRNLFKAATDVYLFDDIDEGLKQFNDYGSVVKRTVDINDFVIFIEDMEMELERRNFMISQEGKSALNEECLVLAIVENQDVIELLAKDTACMKRFKAILTKAKNVKMCFIFSNIENIGISYSSPEILKMLKDNKYTMVLDDINSQKIFDVSMNVARKFGKKVTQGDAYLVSDGEFEKIKLVST